MCNAKNHHKACNCGFGQQGGVKFKYRKQKEFAFSKGKATPRLSFARICEHSPNSRCPSCREPTFYYKNEFGSSVFFDELGPPWPKHPCMDSNNDSPLKLTKGIHKPSAALKDGWQPVELVEAGKNRNSMYEFYCRYKNGKPLTLYVDAKDVEERSNLQVLSEDSICYIKSTEEGEYQISLLSDDLKIMNAKGLR